ncbi:MAG: SCO family protein [Terricaulis sp.]
MRAVLVAAAVCAAAGAALAQERGAHEGSSHAYVTPNPGDLGGVISLRDAAGESFTNANLRGRWTMLYFGYARCRSACPIALPTLAAAADALNARGVTAQAVFVDIEAEPASIQLRSQPASHHDEHAHGAHGAAQEFPGVMLLSGNRLQIRQALTAFRVRTDHMPPRTELGETGHSINHTTAIYIIDPSGAVVDLAYHTTPPAGLVAAIERRAGG